MTVPTTSITDGPYAGNDVATAFAYNFKIDEDTELEIYEVDSAGVISLLVLTTDYTVTGVGDPAGGTAVRVAGALPSGYTWHIRANYIPTQATDFASQGGFYPDVHEYSFDKLSYILQQHEDLISRSIRQHEVDAVLDMRLPVTADRLGTVLAFDEVTGAPVAGPSIAAVGTVVGSVTDIATVAANIADVNTVAADTAAINAVAADLTNVDIVAADIANVNAVGTSIADVNTAAANMPAIIAAPTEAAAAAASAAAAESYSSLGFAAVPQFDLGLITDLNIVFPTDWGTLV